MKITISSVNTGVIIVDVVVGMHAPLNRTPLEIPVALPKLDFEFRDKTYTLTDFGNTSLRPTINDQVSG